MSGKEPKKYKGISRIDSKGTHGWFVRIYHNGETHSKLYSDNKYGGKERALKIAIKARDKATLEIKGKDPSKTKKPNLVTDTKGSNTGVVGVYRTERTYESGNTYEYYKVYWRPRPGEVKSKEWSINKYGQEQAFLQACVFRDRKMREIHGEKYEDVRHKMMPEDVLKKVDGFLNQMA
jgi:hypothetical protein